MADDPEPRNRIKRRGNQTIHSDDNIAKCARLPSGAQRSADTVQEVQNQVIRGDVQFNCERFKHYDVG
jgi:hypothetical protein